MNDIVKHLTNITLIFFILFTFCTSSTISSNTNKGKKGKVPFEDLTFSKHMENHQKHFQKTLNGNNLIPFYKSHHRKESKKSINAAGEISHSKLYEKVIKEDNEANTESLKTLYFNKVYQPPKTRDRHLDLTLNQVRQHQSTSPTQSPK